MRLALLTPLPPEQTGLADYAAHSRWALNQAGVDVLTPLQGQRPIQSFAAAQAWVAERDWRRVDVVHAELGDGRLSEFYTLSALAALPNRPALSVTAHDPERLVWQALSGPARWADEAGWLPRLGTQALTALADPFTLLAERRLARQLDGVVALTHAGGHKLVQRLGIRPDRLSVVPHGVVAVPALALPPIEPVRLLFFGFIHRRKGLEDLIDAVGRLRARHPEQAAGVRLTIAGGTAPTLAEPRSGAYLSELKARIERRGITTQVDWDLDVDERDIPALIQRHHLVVLPHRDGPKATWLGRKEGGSGALAWAIACGRGAIVSTARSLPEEVAAGHGASFPAGDVAALTQALLRVLTEPSLLTQWAQAAHAQALTRTWPTTGQRLAGHFQRTLERAPRKTAL